MIGTGGTYYRIEVAHSDPRQKEVWWRSANTQSYKADAMSVARTFKGQRVRVVRISEECVWANNEALIANGDKV